MNFTVNNSNKNLILIIFIVRFDNPIRTSKRPSTIILPVGGLIQARKFFICPDDFQYKYFWIWGSCLLHHFRQKFLLNKFGGGRVISSGTQIARPAHSPDLNPLDFCYWALAQKEVYSAKLTAVDELTKSGKRFSEQHLENVVQRANLCVQQNGDHFQHLL